MKVFQKMLVAGASMSLIVPIAAQASDVVNLEEMNSYARSQTKSSRIDSKTFINEVSEDIANLKGRVDGSRLSKRNLKLVDSLTPQLLMVKSILLLEPCLTMELAQIQRLMKLFFFNTHGQGT